MVFAFYMREAHASHVFQEHKNILAQPGEGGVMPVSEEELIVVCGTRI